MEFCTRNCNVASHGVAMDLSPPRRMERSGTLGKYKGGPRSEGAAEYSDAEDIEIISRAILIAATTFCGQGPTSSALSERR